MTSTSVPGVRSRTRDWRVHPLVALGLLAGLTIVLIPLALALDHGSPTQLPTPTGRHAVGRAQLFWTDPLHDDPVAPVAGIRRRLVAWIWYPAKRRTGAGRASYMPQPWRIAFEQRIGPVIRYLVDRDLSRVQTHSVDGAALEDERAVYPVVLIRAGLSALTLQYTALAEDLASRGYVVVGVDAPYRSIITVLPNSTVVARSRGNDLDALSGAQQQRRASQLVSAWSDDMRFALDRLAEHPPGFLAGRLRLSHVGVLGHSLGGASALLFCRDEPRCAVAIDIDGAPLGSVVTTGVGKRTMFLLGEHSIDPASEVRKVEVDIHAIYDRLPADQRVLVTVPDSNHFFFSDSAFVQSPLPVRLLRALGFQGFNGPLQIERTRTNVLAFLAPRLAIVEHRRR